jgi:nifR3 family TIM-barrel protein
MSDGSKHSQPEQATRRPSEEPFFLVGGVPIYGHLVLAPMAGYSDQPYRAICRSMGSAMSYSECISAMGLVSDSRRSRRNTCFDEDERPVVLQVIGHDVDRIIDACLRLEQLGPDLIDINLGCPVPRIAERGGGSGLLRTPAKIARIFGALSGRLSIPVTAKIRLGWDEGSLNYLEIARALEEHGAALVAVHGRTRSQERNAPADWDAIAQVVDAIHIPVLGNGGVRCVADIERMKAMTGCDGVMIGRAAIGNPWIFQKRDRGSVPVHERLEVLCLHLRKMVAFYGERRGVIHFRKHAVQYLWGIPGAAQLRTMLMACETQAAVLEHLDRNGLLQGIENVL